jgi:heavy-metal-associated domain-containing protein
MTEKRTRQVVALLLALSGLLLAMPASAQVEKATVKINGMIWGLWAKGAQKALQRLDGVDHADVNLVKGEAQVFPKAGSSFDPVQIPKAIKDAGFSATEVVAEVDGTLTKREGLLEFKIPGLKHPFILSGGPQMDALAARADLVGKKLHITGMLQPGHGALPPGLTVESFQQAP